jgi:hypothetical protein
MLGAYWMLPGIASSSPNTTLDNLTLASENVRQALDEAELALAYRFFDLCFGILDRDWSAEYLDAAQDANASHPCPLHPSPTPHLPLDRYVGSYINDVYGQINVSANDTTLVITSGPRKMQTFLHHWDRDTFQGSTSRITQKERVLLRSLTRALFFLQVLEKKRKSLYSNLCIIKLKVST